MNASTIASKLVYHGDFNIISPICFNSLDQISIAVSKIQSPTYWPRILRINDLHLLVIAVWRHFFISKRKDVLLSLAGMLHMDHTVSL